jgi:adenine phosphoribosyltransferase
MPEFIKSRIRKIPDFPKKGILFYDITTLLKDPYALQYVVNKLMNHYIVKELSFDKVVSMESRGFIFGSILAKELRAGFVPIRKPGKLPAKSIKEEYDLEYGKDSLEIHEDAIDEGDKVLVIDDLLATGGTAQAACKLVERLGGKVENLTFLIELDFLKGREKLKSYDLFSVINYPQPE